jgi:hypothetical protein
MAESVATTITTPDFTDTVNQEFFIEPLSGATNPVSYLENFPETIYTRGLDSNLVSFLYALMGPAGVGSLRKNYLQARLDFEEVGLHTVNLDALYGNIFNFARFVSESYENIPTELLTNEQWKKIQMADASYRNRGINYLKAARAGGTPLGITLAAKSGLNRPVEVVENYRYLYDQYSDNPLGLTRYGVTNSTEEVIILPRQDIPQSVVQTISFTGVATTGTWELRLPIGGEFTTALEHAASFNEVQTALEELPVIGKKNVIVRGGPATSNPFTVSFTNELADKQLPPFEHKSTLEDIDSEPIQIEVEVNRVGVEADGEESIISSSDWYYADLAIGKIKPMTTFLTPGKAKGTSKRHVPNFIHSDSTFTEVIRYVTGLNAVRWPARTGSHWIEAGREHEAPLSQFAQRQHYSNFHNISEISTYDDEALADNNYGTSAWPNIKSTYANEQIGGFSNFEEALYPFLADFKNPGLRYTGSFAVATPPNPLTIQNVAEGPPPVTLIEGIYPIDYQSLVGVSRLEAQKYFWSSAERVEGTDYLEIDLGKVQAVNYLSFTAANKPYDIAIGYDKLDMGPARSFTEATIENSQTIASTTHLGYDVESSNPWKSCEIFFTNSLGQQIFTRYIRLAFTRRPGPPFSMSDGSPIPFTVQVKNLRVGRNLS